MSTNSAVDGESPMKTSLPFTFCGGDPVTSELGIVVIEKVLSSELLFHWDAAVAIFGKLQIHRCLTGE